MKNWYLISILWENGETLSVWNYCTYDSVLRKLNRYMRSTTDGSIIESIHIRACESEEDAQHVAFDSKPEELR